MENWFKPKNVGAVAVLILLSGIGVFWVQKVQDQKEEEGRSALYKVQKTFDEELKGIPEAERAPGVTLEVDQKFSKTVAELKGILSAKSATPRTLFAAAMRLGNLYLEYQQVPKAIESFQVALIHAKSKFQKASVGYLLGSSYELTKNHAEARKALESALAEDVSALKGEILLELIRSSLASQDLVAARKFGARVTFELVGSGFVEKSQELLKELK